MQFVASAEVTVPTEGSPKLGGASAKTLLLVQGTAKLGGYLVELGVSFPGITANEPVVVELIKAQAVTVGTNNTAVTAGQVRGPMNTRAVGGVGATMETAKSCTAEPTSPGVLKAWRVSPTSGLLIQFPLGREPEILGGAEPGLLGLRMLAANAINAFAYMEFIQGPS